jgi:hypothetical protein
MNCPVCFKLRTDVFARSSFNFVFKSRILEKNFTLQNKLTISGGKEGYSFKMRAFSFSSGFFPTLISVPWKASNITSHFATISIISFEGSVSFPSPLKGQYHGLLNLWFSLRKICQPCDANMCILLIYRRVTVCNRKM